MFSPFPVGGPVAGSDLCDRTAELERLVRWLRNGRDVLLLGQSGSGLTSLALAVRKRMADGDRPVRVVDRAERILAKEGGRAEKVPGAASSPPGGGPDPTRLWLSSRLSRADALAGELGSRGSGDPARLELGPVPVDAWLPYGLERFLETDRWVSNHAVLRAAGLAGGHPRRTQEMLSALWCSAEPDGRVPEGAVDAALSRVVARRGWGYRLLERLLTPNQRRLLRGIARASDGGGEVQPFAADFLRACRISSASSSQRALQGLEERELVIRGEEGEEGPRIRDPFLARRLREEGAGSGT